MTDYKTMRVPEAAWEAARDAKQDGETWGEYLQRCADVDTGSTTGNVSVDSDEIARKVVADLEAQLPRKVAEELQR